MAFLNERFPDDIARGAVGGHGCWSTALVELSDGAETAVQQWLRARGIWNVSQGLKIADADGELVEDPRRHEAARDFFYMCRGRLHRFRFKDWGDYKVARSASRVVELTGTTFQAYKVYGADPTFEYLRRLTRLAGTQQLWISDVLATPTTDYTVNADTGVFTIASSPDPATVEFTSEFDVPCRFTMDDYQPTLQFRTGRGDLLLDWSNIQIREARE